MKVTTILSVSHAKRVINSNGCVSGFPSNVHIQTPNAVHMISLGMGIMILPHTFKKCFEYAFALCL